MVVSSLQFEMNSTRVTTLRRSRSVDQRAEDVLGRNLGSKKKNKKKNTRLLNVRGSELDLAG